MLLHEKLARIKSLLERVRRDVADALTIQGVYREPEDFVLTEVGELIRLIKVSDFQFIFDFKQLDSVGRIHARYAGERAGGIGIDIRPFDILIAPIPNLQTLIPIVPAIGKPCGMPDQSITTSPGMDSVIYPTFDFKGIESMEQHLNFIPIEPEVI